MGAVYFTREFTDAMIIIAQELEEIRKIKEKELEEITQIKLLMER